MDESASQVTPVKCRHCDKPMSTPLVCDYCHAISPDASVADHFTLLGLPRRFDLNQSELHRKFIALSRHAHPDFHAGDSPEVCQLHLQVSAALNDAYRTDVRPLLAQVREEMGVPSDPLSAYRASGYEAKIREARGTAATSGGFQ